MSVTGAQGNQHTVHMMAQHTCYKATKVECIASGPLDNKFLLFCTSKKDWITGQY